MSDVQAVFREAASGIWCADRQGSRYEQTECRKHAYQTILQGIADSVLVGTAAVLAARLILKLEDEIKEADLK